MRLLLLADDGTAAAAIDHAERYSLLDLAAHLRRTITALDEGWDLPPPPEPGDGEITAAVP